MKCSRTSARYAPPIHDIELSSSDIKKLYKGKEIVYYCGDGEEYHIIWKSKNKKIKENGNQKAHPSL